MKISLCALLCLIGFSSAQPSLNEYSFWSGAFVVIGKSPDGDSVRFRPDDPLAMSKALGDKVAFAGDGTTQLRLEGIDAPEIHYQGHSQPYSATSRDALLERVGYKRLIFLRQGNLVTSAFPQNIRGTIASKSTDPYGRPIAYVWPTQRKETKLTTSLFKLSLNYRMVLTGHAYPLLYRSNPEPFQTAIKTAAKSARGRKLGVWEFDRTSLFRLKKPSEMELIFPKWFRRLTDFQLAVRNGFSGNFVAWLHANPRENDLILIGGKRFRLEQILTEKQGIFSVRGDITEMVFY